jgi:hypothetical protein
MPRNRAIPFLRLGSKASSTLSPRLNRMLASPRDKTGVSGAPGRNARRSALIRRSNMGPAWAAPVADHVGVRAAAPNPAINSRRFKPSFSLAMRPIRTIFVISVLAVTPCPGAVKKGHFFAAEV